MVNTQLKSAIQAIICLPVMASLLLRIPLASAEGLAVQQPARYMSSCPYYDDAPAIKIGQVVLDTSKIAGLVYDESIVARKTAPWTPEGYILTLGSGAQYLFASKNGTILTVHGGSFTRLGSRPTQKSGLVMQVERYLRKPFTHADIVLTPCFSKPWNGTYVKSRSHAHRRSMQ